MTERKTDDIDAAVLAQLMTAQATFQVLPTLERIAQFVAHALEVVPGVNAAAVCFFGGPRPEGTLTSDHCTTCTERGKDPENPVNFSCPLAKDPDVQSFPLATLNSHLGRIFLKVSEPGVFEPYRPFLINFVHIVALTAETRRQQALLASANRALRERGDSLEREVQARTRELSDVNQSLRQSQAKYRALFEQAGDYILLLRPDEAHGFVIVDANKAACEFHGYTDVEFAGMPIQNLDRGLPPDEMPLLMDRIMAGESVRFETVHRTKDGRAFPIEASAKLLHVQGELALIISVERDITERRRAERQIERQQYCLEKAQELGHIGTWELDCRQDILRWTDENCRIFGVPPGSVVDYQVFIEKVHPDDRAYVDQEWKAAMKGKPYDIEHRLLVDGSTSWVREKADLEFDQNGEATFAIGFTQDITDRKLAEEETRQIEAQMQQAQKLESLGILAGGIAHDFNNILYAILGNIELALEEMPPDATARVFLREIQTAAQRASALTNQMLAYSGKSTLEIEEVDLSALVREMAHLLEISHTKKTFVEYRFGENLPAMEGDASQLRQVVMNLITNASEAGGSDISVETGLTEVAPKDPVNGHANDGLPAGSYVHLQVTDNGCGMDPETQRRMFEPFFTTKFTGRGLGLAAVLGIVRAHNGALDIRSEVGQGTTIRVLFPALERPAKPLIAEAPEGRNWTGAGSILVADDEPQIQTMTKLLLERMGFTVLLAGDGRQAVDVFREHKDEIVCVLLDLTMPHMGGEEAFVELRAIRKGIPVFLVSGYVEEQLEERTGDLGFAGFLKKPVRKRELLKQLQTVLGDAGERAL